jgi:hypothetical protein
MPESTRRHRVVLDSTARRDSFEDVGEARVDQDNVREVFFGEINPMTPTRRVDHIMTAIGYIRIERYRLNYHETELVFNDTTIGLRLARHIVVGTGEQIDIVGMQAQALAQEVADTIANDPIMLAAFRAEYGIVHVHNEDGVMIQNDVEVGIDTPNNPPQMVNQLNILQAEALLRQTGDAQRTQMQQEFLDQMMGIPQVHMTGEAIPTNMPYQPAVIDVDRQGFVTEDQNTPRPETRNTEGDVDLDELNRLEALLVEDEYKSKPAPEEEIVQEKPAIIVPSSTTWVKELNDKGWGVDETSPDWKLDLFAQLVPHPMSYLPNFSNIQRVLSDMFTSNDKFTHAYGTRRRILSKIPLFMFACEDFYPSEWDMMYDGSSQLIFAIHFPKVDLTSSENMKHELLDAYTFIVVQNLENVSLNVTRTTLTEEEVISGYTFSHDHGIERRAGLCSRASVCTGSGEVNHLLAEINTGAENQDSSIELLVAEMQLFISYENSGSPTKRISNITNGGRYVAQPLDSNYFLSELRQRLILNPSTAIPSASLNLSNGAVSVNIVETYTNEMMEFLISMRSVPKCHINTNTGAYTNTSEDVSITLGNSHLKWIKGTVMMTFRGNKIIGKIVKSDKPMDMSSLRLTIHPSVLGNATYYIRSALNSFYNHNNL